MCTLLVPLPLFLASLLRRTRDSPTMSTKWVFVGTRGTQIAAGRCRMFTEMYGRCQENQSFLHFKIHENYTGSAYSALQKCACTPLLKPKMTLRPYYNWQPCDVYCTWITTVLVSGSHVLQPRSTSQPCFRSSPIRTDRRLLKLEPCRSCFRRLSSIFEIFFNI